MEKLVVKTAVKTVLIILGLFLAVFLIFNFAFPQHMATATESIGNYDLAVKYATLRYNYTKSCEDLARCFDDSVLLGNDEYILEYGEKLLKHNNYEEVCRQKNEEQHGSGYDYNHWVKGKIVVSQYNTAIAEKKAENRDKKINEAIKTAVEDMIDGTVDELLSGDKKITSFPYANPLMALSSRVRAEKDWKTAELMIQILNDASAADSTENRYLIEVTTALKSVAKLKPDQSAN